MEEFIKTYMTKNKVFKSDFELYFIDKNENNDFEKKIAEIIDQTIKPRYRYNYLQNLTDINKEVRKHLKSITTYIGNSNYRDAFIFAKLLFHWSKFSQFSTVKMTLKLTKRTSVLTLIMLVAMVDSL